MKRQADPSDLEGDVREVCRRHSAPEAICDAQGELPRYQRILDGQRVSTDNLRSIRDRLNTRKARRLVAKTQRKHDKLLRLLERQRPHLESQLADSPRSLLTFMAGAALLRTTAQDLSHQADFLEFLRYRRGAAPDFGRRAILTDLTHWLHAHGPRPTSTEDGIFVQVASAVLGHEFVKHKDVMAAIRESAGPPDVVSRQINTDDPANHERQKTSKKRNYSGSPTRARPLTEE